MEKTAVVESVWKQRHRLYRKQMRRVARYRVHDPLNQCQVGDLVRIEETRPISKTKHWRILEIMQRRQVADVQPIELEADAEIVVDQPEDTLEESREDAGDVAAVAQADDAQADDTEEEADTGSDDDSPSDSVEEDEPSGDEAGDETKDEETQE
jgi:small subunit ribosomal protein S17